MNSGADTYEASSPQTALNATKMGRHDPHQRTEVALVHSTQYVVRYASAVKAAQT